MRRVCVAVTFGFLAALSVNPAAATCVARVHVHGCARSVRSVEENAAEKIAAARRQQQLAEEASARARLEQDAADAAVARAKQEQQLADDAIARAKREEQAADAAIAQARQDHEAVAVLRQSAEQLQAYLNGKIIEQKQALDAAIHREQEADKRIKDAADEMRQAKLLQQTANEQIKQTQERRRRLNLRFDELLDHDPCGPVPAAEKKPLS